MNVMSIAKFALLGALFLGGCGDVLQSPVQATPPPKPASPETPLVQNLLDKGVKRLEFSNWAGPALRVWYYRPANAQKNAPVLFVFHGVQRDADRYISEWTDLAAKHGIIVVVPEFDKTRFPGARSYNHGALFDENSKPNPRATWTYSAIEPIFDAIVAQERLSATRYTLFGHSAGAQFVHRLVQLGLGDRMDTAITANAGSYAMPTDGQSWPFGFGGLPVGYWQPEVAYRRKLVVLLGTADNDPNYPSLPRDAEAMAQGPHRLARGLKFHEFAQADARDRGIAIAWSCFVAPGVAHNNGEMAKYAIDHVVKTGQPQHSPACGA